MEIFNNEDFSSIEKKLLLSKNVDANLDSAFDKRLFEELSIGKLKVKNHFMFFNLSDDFLFNELGNPKSTFIDFYENISKSGVGLIFMGGVFVSDNKKRIKGKPCLKDKNFSKNIFSTMLSKVHITGSKVFITIKPTYGRCDNENRLFGLFSLSASNNKNYYNPKMPCIRINDNKCDKIIDEIVRSSLLAKKVGFDGIVIDCSLSNVIGELFSKEFNRRVFGYYSEPIDFIKKMLCKIISQNSRLTIFLKITISSLLYLTFGMNAKKIKTIKNISLYNFDKDIFELLKSFVKLGADGFIFEFGTAENEFYHVFNQFQMGNIFNNFEEKIRDYFEESLIKTKYESKVILIFNDNFSNAYEANKLISSGSDFIDITKNIYCDQNFLYNIKMQKVSKKCIKCSICNENSRKFGFIGCTINPNISMKNVISSEFYKNNLVAIIGGGLAGINAAIVLAKRGFSVELHEISNILNKNGKNCEIFGFDKLLHDYNLYLENEINELQKENKILVKLNSNFNFNQELSNKYYSIIVATGYHERYFDVPGAVLKNVISINDFLSHVEYLNSKNYVILAKSELSLKLSLYLLMNNKNVSLIIPTTEFLLQLPDDRFDYYVFMLNKLSAKVYLNAKIKFIQDDYVQIIENKNLASPNFLINLFNIKSGVQFNFSPKAKNIDLDYFIYDPEKYSNNKIYYELVNNNFSGQLFMIGQALQIGNFSDDIKSAFYVASNL